MTSALRFVWSIGLLLLASTAALAQHKHPSVTDWEVSKGAIGMVNQQLYIVVKGENELVLKSPNNTEQRWKGKGTTSQLVFVYKGTVYDPTSLPKDFDLSKAVLISFERDVIRFYDFAQAAGGYYDRVRE